MKSDGRTSKPMIWFGSTGLNCENPYAPDGTLIDRPLKCDGCYWKNRNCCSSCGCCCCKCRSSDSWHNDQYPKTFCKNAHYYVGSNG